MAKKGKAHGLQDWEYDRAKADLEEQQARYQRAKEAAALRGETWTLEDDFKFWHGRKRGNDDEEDE